MKWLLDDQERALVWPDDDQPCGPDAHRWESPDVRAERYEKALRGILAACSNDRLVILLQAAAASALREYALERQLLERLK